MKSLRRHSYDKKRSTIRWMKQTQLQLKLSPVKTKAIQTWTCIRLLFQWGTHSGVSAESASRGIEDRTASVVLIMSSAWRKFTQRQTTTRRSTTVAVDLPLVARIFLQLLVLDGVERLFEHDQAPSKCLPQQQVSGNLLFFATCASLPRRWIVNSPLFVYFLQIFAVSGSDWSRRAATQQTSSKFLVPRKSMKAHAILSMLVGLLQSRAQQKTVFSVAVQLGWLCHARNPLDRRAVQKPWNCQLAEKQTRRVDVFYQNLPHVRNSESRFTSTCLPRSSFLCDRRPTSASRKLEICATRATNKVHIDEQPVGESKKRSLSSF